MTQVSVSIICTKFFIAFLADHAFNVEDGVPPLFASGFRLTSTARTLHDSYSIFELKNSFFSVCIISVSPSHSYVKWKN